MTRHNRQNGLLPAPTCYNRYGFGMGEYGETDVMYFGKIATVKSPTCYGIVVYVADLLATQRGSRQLVVDLLWGNWSLG